MLPLLLTPEYAPFAIAFVVMLGIGLIEAIGLGLGHLDLHADMDAHGGDAGAPALLDWLGLGRGLPILVWLTSLLGCFTVGGFAVQQIATGVTGAPLHAALASLVALAVGGFANVFVAYGLSRVFPAYESSVIQSEDLLMQRGTVLEGAASRGHPARAKVIDQHGQAHYVMVEPHHESDVVAQGETALLVRKDGPIFFVLPDASPSLRAI